MSIASYSDLLSTVADWLARTDLSSRIPDFIALAEARINRDLRVRGMIAQATGSFSSQTLTIPNDFLETVRLTLDTASDLPLEYRPVEDSELRVAGSTSGTPRWFTVVGSDFRFYPTPDGSYDYTLDYYATVPALSPSATTNWLLTKAPDLYLFGSLGEAYSFLLEEDRQAYWMGRFNSVMQSLRAAESRTKRTNGPWRMRVVA